MPFIKQTYNTNTGGDVLGGSGGDKVIPMLPEKFHYRQRVQKSTSTKTANLAELNLIPGIVLRIISMLFSISGRQRLLRIQIRNPTNYGQQNTDSDAQEARQQLLLREDLPGAIHILSTNLLV